MQPLQVHYAPWPHPINLTHQLFPSCAQDLLRRWPATFRQSSMNFSTSVGSNRKGLLPSPIFTAGRYGLRLPEACWMTHEILTPNLLATSFALTSWRIGVDSTPITGKRLPWSLPFRYGMPPSLVQTDRPELYLRLTAVICQKSALSGRGSLRQILAGTEQPP